MGFVLFSLKDISDKLEVRYKNEDRPSGFFLLFVALHGSASVLCQQLNINFRWWHCSHTVTSNKNFLFHELDIFATTGVFQLTKS